MANYKTSNNDDNTNYTKNTNNARNYQQNRLMSSTEQTGSVK
jgi:hypothetical protein